MRQNNFALGKKLTLWRECEFVTQSTADNGDIVVARKGNEYTIKRLRRTASESWLEPANDSFVFGKSEFQIVGLVKYVLRSLKE